MKIAVAVPILNQAAVSQEFFDLLRENEGNTKPAIVIIDNGSKEPVSDWIKGLRDGDIISRNQENIGVLPALNQAWEILKEKEIDYIFYTHNDVMIYEKGWDDKIIQVLEEQNLHGQKVGVAGFYGAKAIGVPGLYNHQYYMQDLIRMENVSNCTRMDPGHGYRPIRNGYCEDVAVMDGFSLIVSVELLNRIGGFDKNYPPHHMYDNDMCLHSLDEGYRNIVISMDAQHLGGRTDVGEDWASGFGKTKQQIHQEAHPIFYEEWSPTNMHNGKHKICLPVRVA